MRRLIGYLILFFITGTAFGQNTYELKYDSVIIGKTTSSSTWLKGNIWMRGLTVGLSTDSVLVFRTGKVFKVPRSQFSASGTVTSITPGTGFTSSTPITTSGTLNVNIGFSNQQVAARYGSNGGITFNSGGNSVIETNANNDINYRAGTTFTADTAAHVWYARVSELMRLRQDGTLQIKSLKSTGTPPTTYGTTANVIIDARGNVSFGAGGSSTNLSLGTPTSTTVPIANDNGTGVIIPAVTTSNAGAMSASDKTKLDGIASGANNYTLPTASASVLGGVKVGSGLSIDGGGVLSATGGSTPSLDLVLLAGSNGGEGSSAYIAGFSSEYNATVVTKTKQMWTGIATKTSNYTLSNNDHTIIGNATFASFTITLPPAANCYDGTLGVGRTFIIKKSDLSVNTLTLKGDGTELIDGANTVLVTSTIMVQSDGTQWWITNN